MKVKVITLGLTVLPSLSLLACTSKKTEQAPGVPNPSTYAAATTTE